MKSKALLLDRDGVINVDRGYVSAREQFEFMPGIFAFLNTAQDMGYRLAILTNQSGVARGFYTVEDYKKLTAWMLKELSGQGIAIDLVIECFEAVAGEKPPYNRESFWRKPNPGMVKEAAVRLSLDLSRSAFIGDHLRDMQAGLAAGVGKCLYLTPDGSDAPEGVQVVKNFDEALKALFATKGSS